jgi:hypothetical protein
MRIELKKLKELKISPLNSGIKFGDDYDWDFLINKIKSEGFNPEKYGYITISSNNVILNGHHRFKILKKLYDDDYEIKVRRLRLHYFLLLTVGLLIILPITLIFNFIKKWI